MTTAQPITEAKTVTQHFALSNCKPYVDYNVGRFGAIVLLLDDDKSGVIVAYLPAGRIINQRHADHLISVWRNRSDLAPLNVFDTAHEIEVVEGTLHVNFIEDDKATTQKQPITTGEQAAVNKIIAVHLAFEQVSRIKPEQHLHDDLGADSLDTIEILLNLEKHLDIEFPEQQFDTIHTVQDIYNAVGEVINTQGPDAEDGEWALGWAYRFGKGPACARCEGKGEYLFSLPREMPYPTECLHCNGSGVVGFKRKQQEQ